MAKDIYQEFLRLTGFEEAEIPEYLPEWRKASEKLGLTEDDVRYATEERIPEHFDVTLVGVRKLLGGYIKEAIDLTKATEYKKKGIKIVYGILPALSVFYYALKMAAPDKVYVSFPDIFLTQTLNGLFHKLSPYLEEAEKSGIPYGCRHCALNKTRYAARRLGIIPSPDISWIWGFVCDEGPKTDEFIRCYYDPDWKTYITRIPHDQPFGTVEDEIDERVEYLANQMRDGFESVQKELDIKVTEEKMQEALGIWRRYSSKIGELNRLMASDLQPFSGLPTAMLGEPLSNPWNTGLAPMEEALDITLKEVRQRVANKEGILPQGAPKLMVNVMPIAVPWVNNIFEQNGVGLAFTVIRALTKKQLSPSRFKDPYMATAETWLRRTATVNLGYKAQIICEQMETYGIDGVVFGFFDFDRWVGSDDRLLAKLVEERTQKPAFHVEGDLWDDRDYSQEALRTRIESICEIMKMRRG